jgi:hypothetical protein
MKNQLPIDGNRYPIPLLPAKSLATTVDTSWVASATNVVTLNADTTFVRMYAVWWDVVVSILWTATTSAFDHIVPAGWVVDISVTDGFTDSWYTVLSAIAFSWTVTSFVVIEY